jgi:hypothetical protein
MGMATVKVRFRDWEQELLNTGVRKYQNNLFENGKLAQAMQEHFSPNNPTALGIFELRSQLMYSVSSESSQFASLCIIFVHTRSLPS